MISSSKGFASLLQALLLVTAAFAVQAQTYPGRPIRFIVPYTPGGLGDPSRAPWGKASRSAWGIGVESDIAECMLALAGRYKYDAGVSMLEDLEAAYACLKFFER